MRNPEIIRVILLGAPLMRKSRPLPTNLFPSIIRPKRPPNLLTFDSSASQMSNDNLLNQLNITVFFAQFQSVCIDEIGFGFIHKTKSLETANQASVDWGFNDDVFPLLPLWIDCCQLIGAGARSNGGRLEQCRKSSGISIWATSHPFLVSDGGQVEHSAANKLINLLYFDRMISHENKKGMTI